MVSEKMKSCILFLSKYTEICIIENKMIKIKILKEKIKDKKNYPTTEYRFLHKIVYKQKVMTMTLKYLNKLVTT
jgi:hypothetical protein